MSNQSHNFILYLIFHQEEFLCISGSEIALRLPTKHTWRVNRILIFLLIIIDRNALQMRSISFSESLSAIVRRY